MELITYPFLLQQVLNEGGIVETRGKVVKEWLATAMVVRHDRNFFCYKNVRPFKYLKRYLEGELCWYLSGSRRAEDIGKYSKFWLNLADPLGLVNSNYGYMVFGKTEGGNMSGFTWAHGQLIKDKHTRQAIIHYGTPEMNYDNNKDYTCTQTQQFFIRNNHLMCVVNIRSSDMVLGLTYDIPWWSLVHQNMHLHLKKHYPDLKMSDMFIFFGSVHIYEDKWNLVAEMQSDPMDYFGVKLKQPLVYGKPMSWYEKNLMEFISYEKA